MVRMRAPRLLAQSVKALGISLARVIEWYTTHSPLAIPKYCPISQQPMLHVREPQFLPHNVQSHEPRSELGQTLDKTDTVRARVIGEKMSHATAQPQSTETPAVHHEQTCNCTLALCFRCH